jgi:hypothetical protein
MGGMSRICDAALEDLYFGFCDVPAAMREWGYRNFGASISKIKILKNFGEAYTSVIFAVPKRVKGV